MVCDPSCPVWVFLYLKRNQPGFENYVETVAKLDQREDAAYIGLGMVTIPVPGFHLWDWGDSEPNQ